MRTRAFLAALAVLAIGSPLSAASSASTVINVTAGRPSEFAFTLSRTTGIPSGSVVFRVSNRGALPHAFKVCTAPVTTAKANACAGETTAAIKPGKTATLTVTFAKGGLYEYLSNIAGQAAKGMKGLIGVATAAAPPAPTPIATPTTTAPAGPVTTTTPAPTSTATGTGAQLFVDLGCSSCHTVAEVRGMGVPITTNLNVSHPLQFPKGPLTASEVNALAAYISGS